MRKVNEEGLAFVVAYHKREVDAATELMDMASDSTLHRDHGHAIDLLNSAIEHLKVAEILQRVLKDVPPESEQG